MKAIKRYIKQARLLVESLKNSEDLYCIHADNSPELFLQKAHEWQEKNIEVHDDIDKALLAGLRFILPMLGWGNSANALRNTVISKTFFAAQKYVFAAHNRQNIIVYDVHKNKAELQCILDKINAIFTTDFNTTLTLKKAEQSVIDELLVRINEAEEFYINEHGNWTQNFIENLGDELSKISFRDFLMQRVVAHILWHAKAMYPIESPKESAEWRKERRKNPPHLPIIDHCPKNTRDFFHLHSFIYEQYGIEGVVEAKEGDIVIDAGAYIADTALYFAPKVGDTGKVFAFEIFPKSVEDGNDNLQKNNVTNVEMLPFALSDKNETLYFSINEEAPSGSTQNSSGELEVRAMTVDHFAKERNIKVGFIKSDIEGGEMALLRGAQESIKQDKPTCGIALYHKQADYFEVPQLLSSLCPEYTYYFRCEAEPVLFAQVEK